MAMVQGHCDPRFEPVKQLLAEKIANGEELGASLVLNIGGKDVVDIWGGYFDEAKTKPWESDTITNVWSSTKTIATFACLVAHERGLLNVDDPVAKYWPEFGAKGKEGVLVRHLMSHTAGVAGWDDKITAEEICDVPSATARLAEQAPWWEPGTASGYHSVSMGHLLGEVIRRSTGKPMKQFVAEEIAGPLGADMQIGAAEKDWPRVSPVTPPPPMAFDFAKMDPNSPTVKAFSNPPMDARVALEPYWRRADMAAVNGHTNARSLNRILRAIPNGGTVDGVKLLSPETVELIFREQANGTDLVIGMPLRFGIGYGLGGGCTAQTVPWLPTEKMCFWGGWGGSLEIMDCHRNVTFTYVMNKMGEGILGNSRSKEFTELVWKILKEQEEA
ncbi:beta-lactamase [Cladophialophora psammophila CBS 110553]|uniref:Beta-lactamase n=1 Tax=Cladophialophora psammophila CBS 110553 TaxID=1182543 RepID=W9XJI4_9EURO|nr:beta-lactamase [Cladophialophora psammophila CBS 110553]EXJ70524.1 beta-lactamase [Cladophialophora psammophila CBS 110553]